MKIILILCLLALSCTVDATIFKILLLRVKHAKKTVENTVRQLQDLHSEVVRDTDLTVTKKWWELLEKHRNHINPILEKIRKDVESAKMKGKNAQHCYDIAAKIIDTVDHTAYNDAEQCKEAAKMSIERNLCFIDNLILTGQKLIAELDDIFPKCYDNVSGIKDFLKLRKCIVHELDISNGGVKDLQRDASSSRYNANLAFSVVDSQSSDCLNNVYSNARLKAAEATPKTARCLEIF